MDQANCLNPTSKSESLEDKKEAYQYPSPKTTPDRPLNSAVVPGVSDSVETKKRRSVKEQLLAFAFPLKTPVKTDEGKQPGKLATPGFELPLMDPGLGNTPPGSSDTMSSPPPNSLHRNRSGVDADALEGAVEAVNGPGRDTAGTVNCGSSVDTVWFDPPTGTTTTSSPDVNPNTLTSTIASKSLSPVDTHASLSEHLPHLHPHPQFPHNNNNASSFSHNEQTQLIEMANMTKKEREKISGEDKENLLRPWRQPLQPAAGDQRGFLNARNESALNQYGDTDTPSTYKQPTPARERRNAKGDIGMALNHECLEPGEGCLMCFPAKGKLSLVECF